MSTGLSCLGSALAMIVAVTVAVPARVMAQVPLPSATVVGVVRDSGGQPIAGVEVWLKGSDFHTHTAENGGFRLAGAPAGASKMSVRRMGYEPTTFDVELHSGLVDSLVVSLTAVPTTLAGMTVEDVRMTRSKRFLPGFWERRTRGFGHYLTRDEIEATDSHDFTDILRMTPGVSIVTVNGRRTVRFGRSIGLRGDCPPQYWVDGMRIENGSPDDFHPGDVEALEVYAGPSTIPAQFAARSAQIGQRTCGAIVVWTRLPGS